MSKNIEDIVNEILPQDFNSFPPILSRERLTQALAEGKLVVPLSEDAILKLINSAPKEYPFFKGRQQPVKIPVWTVSNGEQELAKAIYQAQFGGNK